MAFFKRLISNIARPIREKITSPLGRALGLSRNRSQQAIEDNAAVEEARRQEQDSARQSSDQKANLQAQQSVMIANQQAEDAIAKAQRDAPVDRLDIVLGDSDSSTGFNFRRAASGAAGDAATFARKARSWFRR